MIINCLQLNGASILACGLYGKRSYVSGMDKDDDLSSCISDSVNNDRWNGSCNYSRASIETAFKCFRLIMECKNISRQHLNKLFNSTIKDNVHIIGTYMTNSIVNNSFIKYLVETMITKDGKLIIEIVIFSNWHV